MSALDAPRWSAPRIIGSLLLYCLLIVLLAVAAGWIAAEIEMSTGSRAGRWYAKAVVLGVAGIIPAALVSRLWRRSRAAEQTATPGEVRAIRRSRSYWSILGMQFAIGGIMGFLFARYILHGSGGLHTLPPAAAMIMALAYLVATIASSIAFYPRMDELDRQDSLWGGSAAASVVIVLYPAWLFLWLGGWVREPMHEVLFGLMLVVWTATYLFRKSRH